MPDALAEWDTQVQEIATARIVAQIEWLAMLPNERDIEAGIEDLYYHLTGRRLGDPDDRAGLWAIIHAVFAKRLLMTLEKGGPHEHDH